MVDNKYKLNRRGFIKNTLKLVGSLALVSAFPNCGKNDICEIEKKGVPLYREPSLKYDEKELKEFFRLDKNINYLDENIARLINKVCRNYLGKEIGNLGDFLKNNKLNGVDSDFYLSIYFTGLSENDNIAYGGMYDTANIEIIENSFDPSNSYRTMCHEVGHYFDNPFKNERDEFISVFYEYLIPMLTSVEIPSLKSMKLTDTVYTELENRINAGLSNKTNDPKISYGTLVFMEYFLACNGNVVETENLLRNTPIEVLRKRGVELSAQSENVYSMKDNLFNKLMSIK